MSTGMRKWMEKGKGNDMDFTHPSLFGKDHWSLLAYVETCCVDGHD